jgi:hypothetical protein
LHITARAALRSYGGGEKPPVISQNRELCEVREATSATHGKAVRAVVAQGAKRIAPQLQNLRKNTYFFSICQIFFEKNYSSMNYFYFFIAYFG